MQHTFKTRIAPTPSGYLHLGNAMAFSFTYLYARLHGLKILLRIDDADQARYRDAYAEGIFKTLESLGINWDEGPFSVNDLHQEWSQHHRVGLYQKALNQLKEKEALFACTCSRKQWQAQSPGYPGWCLEKNMPLSTPQAAWRLKHWPGQIALENLTEEWETHVWPQSMDYFVVRQKNQRVAYQLSSLVDDQHFNITHVIRGADLLPSTLAQMALAKELGSPFIQTRFHHHPLWAPQGEKLSKSQKAPPVLELLQASGGGLRFMKVLSLWLGFTQPYQNLEEALTALKEGEEKLF